MKFRTLFIVAVIALFPPFASAQQGKGRGPGHEGTGDDFRGVIHSLFAAHEKVERSVEKTEKGYKATTTSRDPEIAAMLQTHVAQMKERLDGGLNVRRWDPAFVEMREHYADMEVTIENVEGGVAVSVIGKTPEAVLVAQNHADIVSGFVKEGEERMHAKHPLALKEQAETSESETPGKDEQERILKTGMEASDALIKSLGGQLKAAMQASGPVGAIQVCQQVALPLTTATGESMEGVTMRRTSVRVRNPENRPDARDLRILEIFAAKAGNAEGPPEPVIEWSEGTAHFYRPLMMQEVCLNCHGDPASFPADLQQTLAALYPEDEATGFAAGELRGVIRVDVARSRP